MTFFFVTGCLLIAFGPALAIFIQIIARDPLRIILFVLGAFFWLMSLLFSALFWFAIVPLRDTLAFSLAFAILLQEVFRFLFFLLLKQAEVGLEKVSQATLQMTGVHSLKDARHTIALVCGLGFGVMSGLFGLLNVAADSWGDGVPGLPENTGLPLQPNQMFFVYSSLAIMPSILLNMCWTVLFWDSCHKYYCTREKKHILQLLLVVASHYAVSYASFINQRHYYYIFLPLEYGVLLLTFVWTYIVSGGTAGRFCSAVKTVKMCCGGQSATPAESVPENQGDTDNTTTNPQATNPAQAIITGQNEGSVVIRR